MPIHLINMRQLALSCVGVTIISIEVYAHEPAAQGNIFIGAGVQSVRTESAFPQPHLLGILDSGYARENAEGDALTYIEFGANIPAPDNHLISLKAGHHDETDAIELEQAWIGNLKPYDSQWQYQLGRQLVPMGYLNQTESHARKLAVAPLTLRATLNDSWRSDGLVIQYTGPKALFGNPLKTTFGLWNNQSFPGSSTAHLELNTYSLRVESQVQSVQFTVNLAQFNVNGRAYITQLSTDGTHSHTQPNCDQIDNRMLCFQGDTRLVNASLLWPVKALNFVLEVFYKHETGTLESLFGSPKYTGEFFGGWLETQYQINQNWQMLARIEQGQSRHYLEGNNVRLIATQANIAEAEKPLTAYALGINYSPNSLDKHFFSFEAYQQNNIDSQNEALLLRYQFQFSMSAF